jgi:hypothetical protein
MILHKRGVFGKISTKITVVEQALFGAVVVAFMSLFLDIKIGGGVTIRPFDILVVTAGVSLVLLNIISGRFNVRVGFLLIICFFVWETCTAILISKDNFFREALQSLVLLMFAYPISMYSRVIDWKFLGFVFAIYGSALVLFMIGWHVAQGKYFGWKDFNAMKTMFTYVTPAVFAYRVMHRKSANLWDYVVIVLFAVALFYSGERKAQIGFLGCVALAAVAGYLSRVKVASFAVAVIFAVPILAASNPYLMRQANFFAVKDETSHYTLSQYQAPPPDGSPSNLQRHFANSLAPEIVRTHLITGLGTNGFMPYVTQRFKDRMPYYYIQTIHNEFERIIVENGIVGLALYCFAWIRSLVWLGVKYQRLSLRTKCIYGMFYLSLFLECFFEGSGTRAFVAFIVTALLPEFFANRLKRGEQTTKTPASVKAVAA